MLVDVYEVLQGIHAGYIGQLRSVAGLTMLKSVNPSDNWEYIGGIVTDELHLEYLGKMKDLRS